jgi:hypothetical protein
MLRTDAGSSSFDAVEEGFVQAPMAMLLDDDLAISQVTYKIY